MEPTLEQMEEVSKKAAMQLVADVSPYGVACLMTTLECLLIFVFRGLAQSVGTTKANEMRRALMFNLTKSLEN